MLLGWWGLCFFDSFALRRAVPAHSPAQPPDMMKAGGWAGERASFVLGRGGAGPLPRPTTQSVQASGREGSGALVEYGWTGAWV